MSKPLALIFRTAGTNCDAELCRAFEMAGASAELVHVDRVVREPKLVERAELIGFPGGFSHGDDIAAGRVLAVKLRERLWGPVRDAAERGVPMIGPCNGFQVMVQVGLLPGFAAGAWPERAPDATLALAENAGGRFIDKWVGVEAPANTVCVWTSGVEAGADAMRLPIAHGEGRLVAASDAVIEGLEAGGQVALRYAEGENPNGSAARIAGVCDPSGRIFGLMPHPERYLDWGRHPYATRLDGSVTGGQTPGLSMFKAAVASLGVPA